MNLRSTLDRSPLLRLLRKSIPLGDWWPTVPFRCTSPFIYESTASLQASTLGWIRLAHSSQLNVGQIMEGHASEHGYSRRMLLGRFAERIQNGLTLVEALEQTPGVLSQDDVLALRFGQQNGTFGETLDRLCQPPDRSVDPPLVALRRTLRYVRLLAVVLLLFFIFTSNYIYPTYRYLLFEIGAANSTIQNQGRSDVTYGLTWLQRLIDGNPMLCLACLVVIVATTVLIQRPGMDALSKLINRVTGFAGKRATTLDLLADAASKGRPMIAAVSSLARLHQRRDTRQALLFARNEMDHGVATWESLHQCGVFNAHERNALTAMEGDEEPWLMRSLATRDRDLRLKRRTLFVAVFHCVAVVVLACIVGSMAYLTFFTLTGLIHALA